ncbi:MAG TPA: low temperature requirement protein A [bacterium]
MPRPRLFKPPALQSGSERERHATWLELFYDLIFVGAVAQLAATFYGSYDFGGLARFAFLSLPVWWAWAGHTFYLTRFDTDDAGHRLLTMAQMIAVAAMASNVAGAFGPSSGAFALSYAAVRAVLVAQYLRAGHHLPEARPLTRRYSRGFGAAALIWALSVLFPPQARPLVWAAAIAVDFLTPITAGTIHSRFPPHQMHLPERFGLFTIIVLGEAVVGVVSGEGTGGLALVPALAGVMGLVIAFALWWGYFEGVGGASIRVVRTFEHVPRYQLWLYAHLPLIMGITATAVGVRHVIGLPPFQPLPAAAGWILSGAVGASCLALAAILLASYPAGRYRELRGRLAAYLVIAILGIGTGFIGGRVPGVAVLAILMALSVAQIAFSLQGLPAAEQ